MMSLKQQPNHTRWHRAGIIVLALALIHCSKKGSYEPASQDVQASSCTLANPCPVSPLHPDPIVNPWVPTVDPLAPNPIVNPTDPTVNPVNPTPPNLPAQEFSARGTTTGTYSNLTLQVDVRFNSGDFDKPGAVFLYAVFDSKIYVCAGGCPNNSWKLWDPNATQMDWSLSGFRNKLGLKLSNADQFERVYNATHNLVAAGGAEVFVGYGVGSSVTQALQEMLNHRSNYFSNGRHLKVATIPKQPMTLFLNGPDNKSPGALSQYNLWGYVFPSYLDYGKPGSVFVVAYNADQSIRRVLRKSDNAKGSEWVDWDGTVEGLAGNFLKRSSALPNDAFPVFSGDARGLVGFNVIVGYGIGSSDLEAAQDCVNNKKYSQAWIVQ